MKIVKFLASLLVAGGLVYFLDRPMGTLPALGKLFSPFDGFWQNGESKISSNEESTLQLAGIKGNVTVKFDENHVPHIFAENDDDLYYTQGYLVAKDRLWQMQFYTMVAAGRLTEAVGEKALEFDRYNRRLGMAETAKKVAVEMLKDPVCKNMMESYSRGVNDYIKQLNYKNLPIEYKILGYMPEEWSPEKSALLLQQMRNTLNGGSDDYKMSNIMAKYGSDVVKELFPDYPIEESPIIPVGTKWDFTPVKIPAVPTAVLAKVEKVAYNSDEGFNLPIPSPRNEIGSNNWAVGGAKSATGLPILSNDPHLQLTLPSIWYQVQLVSPTMNVYGVCLPGAPSVTIGFNKDIAWGVTNVASDVMDFYQIKFKDKTMKEYWYDGAWKPTTMRIEEFKIKGKKESVKDTVYFTHQGPILYNQGQKTFKNNVPTGCAMRWVGHETSGNDLMAFYYLNRAKNYADYRKALTFYTAPAQNFIFASNENDIAITPNGKLPLKWKEQGKFIMDGSNPANDWQGWIPTEQNPTVKNPPRGFVSSANQFSTDPTYPYYLSWKYSMPDRGIRINERLAAMTKATPDSLRALQNDNFNIAARRILPELLKVLTEDSSMKQNPQYKILASWNMRNNKDEVGATIFERWGKELLRTIWEDEFITTDDKAPMLYPTIDITFNIIKKNPKAKWFDDVKTTNKVETLHDIVALSFKASIDSLLKNNGPMTPTTWAWGKVKSTDIKHLVPQFTAFSRMDIDNGGGAGIVNATTPAGTGPSWRMIVQLGKGNVPMKAYGLYPGGQSGNPASQYYDNMIDKWTKGELNELLFLTSKDEKSSRVISTIKISK